jgi:hypothetical protein
MQTVLGYNANGVIVREKKICDFITDSAASFVQRSEFLASRSRGPGSIPEATRLSEK